MRPEPITSIYSLRDPDEIRRRLEILQADHIAPLTGYVDHLRASLGRKKQIPYFDPLDGGINATILFLLEAPGPKAVESGFVSRDNPDPTARNMNQLMTICGVPRWMTVLWNIVPWHVDRGGSLRPVNQEEINAGLGHLKSLRHLLPNLRAVVLVGGKARNARPAIEALFHTRVFACPSPSQRVLNVWPEKRGEIISVFRKAVRLSLEKD